MKNHLIDINATTIEALTRLNALSGNIMTLFAVDTDGKMLGTLTDGDIRRALIAGHDLTTPVGTIMHREFRAMRGLTIDVTLLRKYRNDGLRLIPWLNTDGSLRQLIDLSQSHSLLPMSAILMAGGKGERLRPLTLDTPKPLLEIGGKAIIDYNIEALARCGITDIYVTIRYLAGKMREHFSSPVAGVNVKCVEETLPLGTLGAAALCQLPDHGLTLVMNSDLLTNISFEDMYLHHISQNSDITVAVIPYQVSVPFAIITTDPADPSRVTGIEEKPSYSHYANAGIYIFNNKILRKLSTTQRSDATDVIAQAIDDGRRVTHFPINGTWIDVGSPADFTQAQQLMKYVNG